MPLFHFQPNERQPGEIIQQEISGQLIRTHEALVGNGRVMVTGMLCREMLWESIRLARFKSLPSRLDCVFLLPERTDADSYAVINNAGDSGTYV